MIVDDEKSLVTIVEKKLVRRGFEVKGITDGKDVERELQTFDPDVIITDMHMPGFMGHQVISSLVESNAETRSSAKKVQVIVISGGDFDEDVMQLLKKYEIPHIGKPIDFDWLVKLIDEYQSTPL